MKFLQRTLFGLGASLVVSGTALADDSVTISDVSFSGTDFYVLGNWRCLNEAEKGWVTVEPSNTNWYCDYDSPVEREEIFGATCGCVANSTSEVTVKLYCGPANADPSTYTPRGEVSQGNLNCPAS